MAAAASMPGAKNAAYATPAICVGALRSTRWPRPAPTPTRNSSGLATLTTIVPRQVRRYASIQ